MTKIVGDFGNYTLREYETQQHFKVAGESKLEHATKQRKNCNEHNEETHENESKQKTNEGKRKLHFPEIESCNRATHEFRTLLLHCLALIYQSRSS